ncbi:hypothetical protein KIW84_012888 [Lathyrus oleraceus]|uniref:Uncharacterized protein n=1 Tax=Pisum sativum TaxID=3888 RepID=A0A9D5BIW6_PEA|nr:hypothetical protein KIW84_012888 [Pisum sativum]
MEFVLQGQHPGSTGNLVHGPAFIFSPVHYQASVLGASNNSPYATTVHNNSYSFLILITSLAATVAIKGASPSQTTHMQSGPLYSSQTFQPFQDPQHHPHSQALLQPSYPMHTYQKLVHPKMSCFKELREEEERRSEVDRSCARDLRHHRLHIRRRLRQMPCRGLDQAQIELVLHLPVVNAPPGLGSEAVGPPGAEPNRFRLKRPMLC